MKRLFSILIAYAVVITFLLSCGNSRPSHAKQCDAPADIWPDYKDVTIPVDFAPLNFALRHVEKVYVEVKGNEGSMITARGDYADFDVSDWHRLLRANKGGHLTVSVYGKLNDEWVRYRDFKINVSGDSLAAWGLTYRRVAPGYESYSKMGIYQRNLSNFDEFPILENTEVSGMCINCHTSNHTKANQFTLHVRGSHGATLIQRNGNREWLDTRTDSTLSACVYPYWHPTGRYCAYSNNLTHQVFLADGKRKIEVYDNASDVVVLDVDRHELISCDALRSSKWSENTPAFSPDGKWLYYITAPTLNMPAEYKSERYDICRIAFDAATGTFGNTVDTLVHASVKGRSASWPRPSYDGRFLMFTEIDYGYFTIWHPEAEQWLLDLATGTCRPMDSDARSGCFHNWSADSRWVVYTSRAENGLYTRLYLVHIDKDGRISRPVLLPQKNPEVYERNMWWSFNIPDFIDGKVNFDNRTSRAEIYSNQRVKIVKK